jgi:hypothetical protein
VRGPLLVQLLLNGREDLAHLVQQEPELGELLAEPGHRAGQQFLQLPVAAADRLLQRGSRRPDRPHHRGDLAPQLQRPVATGLQDLPDQPLDLGLDLARFVPTAAQPVDPGTDHVGEEVPAHRGHGLNGRRRDPRPGGTERRRHQRPERAAAKDAQQRRRRPPQQATPGTARRPGDTGPNPGRIRRTCSSSPTLGHRRRRRKRGREKLADSGRPFPEGGPGLDLRGEVAGERPCSVRVEGRRRGSSRCPVAPHGTR